MRAKTVFGVLACVLVTLVSACGSEEPIASYAGFRHRQSGDVPVFGRYRESAAEVSRTVRLPAGTRHVMVHMDCIGHGTISVDVLHGQVAVPCGATSESGGSAIGMTQDAGLSRASTTRVDVRAPKSSTWSVSVDAGPGPINPILSQ